MADDGHLDSHAIEARTQAIGRELIAAAKERHEHFSVLNRWTEEVLSWCTRDEALKGSVLRFIDVLPSLRSARDVARHVREYFPNTGDRMPAALRVGASLTRGGLLTAPAVAAVVRRLVERVAAQFIAESHPEGVRQVIVELADRDATCSLDILGEAVLAEDEADAYVRQYVRLVREASAAYASLGPRAPFAFGPRVNVSIKPTALTPRFDPIAVEDSIARAARALRPVLREAGAVGAAITLDMEQYEVRDLTLALARRVLEDPDLDPKPPLGIVLQAYLLDAENILEEILAWTEARKQPLWVRLVKGAYWDYEVALGRQRHWPVPVQLEKAATDTAFERMTVRLLRARPLVRTALASHNLRSIAHAMAVAEALEIGRGEMEFQLLYGMAEGIHGAIAARGYPVRIYTPVGELIPGMGYLVRRLLENTANESFLRRDFLDLANAEALLAPPRRASGESVPGGAPRGAAWYGEPTRDFSRAAARAEMSEALDAVRRRFGERRSPQLADGAREGGEVVEVRSPANLDRVIGHVCFADDGVAHDAVASAVEASSEWERIVPGERVLRLRRAAEIMRAERCALAAWEVFEVGKPWREADADVVEAIDYLEYYGAQMEDLERGRVLAEPPGERNAYLFRPRGVTAVIAPWNFPLAIATGMVSAALVTGNTVIFKPAEQSSICGAELVRILRAAGVPAGALQFLPGGGETVGNALVTHPQVAQILFTGSRAVGLGIVEAASRVAPGQRCVKHVVAEMGGKNALIIDADADLDAAIAGTVVSAFGYGGQKCSAASRIIVHAAVAERFVARLAAAADRLVVGDPADPRTDVGPLIDAAARERLLEAKAAAAKLGTIVYEFPEQRLPQRGHFVGPVLVADIDPASPIAREELFGPLVCVFVARTFDQALALANDSDYALTGGVYSRSPAHLQEAARVFDVGNLYFNRPITGAAVGRQPFGGHRLSGLGAKAGGPDYLVPLMLPVTISEDMRRHGMPLA